MVLCMEKPMVAKEIGGLTCKSIFGLKKFLESGPRMDGLILDLPYPVTKYGYNQTCIERPLP